LVPRKSFSIMEELTALLGGATLSPPWLKQALNITLAAGVGVGPLKPHEVVESVEDISFPGRPVETGQSISYAVQCRVMVGPTRGSEHPGSCDGNEDGGGGTSSGTARCCILNLWLKKVQGRRFPTGSSLAKLKRDLASCRNECAFYRSLAPRLRRAGFAVPTPVHIAEDIGEVDLSDGSTGGGGGGGGDEATDEASNEAASRQLSAARRVAFELLLEGVDGEALAQRSPLAPAEALCTLDFLARLHAWAWEDPARYRGGVPASSSSLSASSSSRSTATLAAGAPATTGAADTTAAAATSAVAAGGEATPLLHTRGSYWELGRRGAAEVAGLAASWHAFVDAVAPDDASGGSGGGGGGSERWCHPLRRPGMGTLGARLAAIAPWVAQQLHGDGGGCGDGEGLTRGKAEGSAVTTPWCTLIHGDFKALNCFVPRGLVEGGVDLGSTAGCDGRGCVPIDFQWSGGGSGMLDVALHLHHALTPEDLGHRSSFCSDSSCGGGGGGGGVVGALEPAATVAARQPSDHFSGSGEEALVRFYHGRLCGFLGSARAAAYPWETVGRVQYHCAVVDYARVVVGCFWRGAGPAAFAAKAENENCAMVYRSEAAACRFAVRAEESVAFLERHRAGLKAEPKSGN